VNHEEAHRNREQAKTRVDCAAASGFLSESPARQCAARACGHLDNHQSRVFRSISGNWTRHLGFQTGAGTEYTGFIQNIQTIADDGRTLYTISYQNRFPRVPQLQRILDKNSRGADSECVTPPNQPLSPTAAPPGQTSPSPVARQPGNSLALDAIFKPQSVAVIGATDREGSVGCTALVNLTTAGFRCKVYAVNPKRSEVMGVASFPSIGAVPQQIDLAVIVTPAATVPGVIGECIAAGVKGAVIISAGFREHGAEGRALE
jgi:predicted CoA-binding protein